MGSGVSYQTPIISTRPGIELITHRGLHKFMGRILILTDSSGFQVYSLADNITEEA